MKPILQLALDHENFSRALKVAGEAVAGGVDWIEAGTPLIKSEGLEAVVELERDRGYLEAQEQVTTYLSDRDWCPLAELLAERLEEHDPEKSIAFLTRVAAMAPGIYDMSKLLDQMQGKTRMTTILFYPGSIEGTTGLRYMDLKDREALGNYRVKIYG